MNVKLLKNALRFPGSHLPLSSVDFGYQFNEQANKSIENGNLSKIELESIQQRSSNFWFRLCNEMCNRSPDNLEVMEKIKYLSPVELFYQVNRPTFSQLPTELAGI